MRILPVGYSYANQSNQKTNDKQSFGAVNFDYTQILGTLSKLKKENLTFDFNYAIRGMLANFGNIKTPGKDPVKVVGTVVQEEGKNRLYVSTQISPERTLQQPVEFDNNINGKKLAQKALQATKDLIEKMQETQA